eukprot:gb/GECH01004180.1/.p1 GENE.gb/GECH01004180.1/~~gb/GECH01004180.1/.p1  ORF type:complete len:435 (+),score=75.28 gb/GECH01004180.1/:1-1305(+)
MEKTTKPLSSLYEQLNPDIELAVFSFLDGCSLANLETAFCCRIQKRDILWRELIKREFFGGPINNDEFIQKLDKNKFLFYCQSTENELIENYPSLKSILEQELLSWKRLYVYKRFLYIHTMKLCRDLISYTRGHVFMNSDGKKRLTTTYQSLYVILHDPDGLLRKELIRKGILGLLCILSMSFANYSAKFFLIEILFRYLEPQDVPFSLHRILVGLRNQFRWRRFSLADFKNITNKNDVKYLKRFWSFLNIELSMKLITSPSSNIFNNKKKNLPPKKISHDDHFDNLSIGDDVDIMDIVPNGFDLSSDNEQNPKQNYSLKLVNRLFQDRDGNTQQWEGSYFEQGPESMHFDPSELSSTERDPLYLSGIDSVAKFSMKLSSMTSEEISLRKSYPSFGWDYSGNHDHVSIIGKYNGRGGFFMHPQNWDRYFTWKLN